MSASLKTRITYTIIFHFHTNLISKKSAVTGGGWVTRVEWDVGTRYLFSPMLFRVHMVYKLFYRFWKGQEERFWADFGLSIVTVMRLNLRTKIEICVRHQWNSPWKTWSLIVLRGTPVLHYVELENMKFKTRGSPKQDIIMKFSKSFNQELCCKKIFMLV